MSRPSAHIVTHLKELYNILRYKIRFSGLAICKAKKTSCLGTPPDCGEARFIESGTDRNRDERKNNQYSN
jgi:hypothetical protein